METNREENEFENEEGKDQSKAMETLACPEVRRKEKRKLLKKLKRKQIRKDIALKERAEEEARSDDPEEQRKLILKQQEEAEMMERQRKEFEERERLWMEKMAQKAQEEEEEEKRRKSLEEEEEARRKQIENENELNEDDDWEYVEEGPAEIIWEGNEIIVKKKRVKVPKGSSGQRIENADRPTSNPLPPQSEAFSSYKNTSVSSKQVFESVSNENPNFGTEQDKAHCPFHIKTGACRFGSRCSRVHFYPDKSCTLLIKNMYSGPGLAWEQDEGLEVCRNGSYHLRGNVYVHYKSLDSALLAYHYINGRYFGGKQITCEYVGVTRWKVAICGEYMKSGLETCSRGTACNFIHCFRNPGGDYEWADWDKPAPKYWVKKMTFLFGTSDESGYEHPTGPESRGQRRRNSSTELTEKADRRLSRRSGSRDVDHRRNTSDEVDNSVGQRCSSSRHKYLCSSRNTRSSRDDYYDHDYSARDRETHGRRSRHSRKWKDHPDDHENVERKSRGNVQSGNHSSRTKRAKDDRANSGDSNTRPPTCSDRWESRSNYSSDDDDAAFVDVKSRNRSSGEQTRRVHPEKARNCSTEEEKHSSRRRGHKGGQRIEKDESYTLSEDSDLEQESQSGQHRRSRRKREKRGTKVKCENEDEDGNLKPKKKSRKRSRSRSPARHSSRRRSHES